MFEKYWPIALIVAANIIYNVCAKGTSDKINPLASLTVSYAVAAVLSGILYAALNRCGNLIEEYRHLNWTPVLLGAALVGLEAGCLYMYKAGWNISTGHLVHSTILAVLLVFIGWLFYHENLTPSKIAGAVLCMVGIVLINR